MSITNYLKGVKTEFFHITWPTRRQTIIFTIVVIVIALAVAYYLGLLDLIFSRILEIVL